ncbi:MAG: HD domain-containing protein [Gammaproteobacteria bacterium]|nr:HD domain-containing protein [Gammaproteobacteria bacterium]MDE2345609.1 HD domain-containing protein [Gammaproteobacteria bacterium]
MTEKQSEFLQSRQRNMGKHTRWLAQIITAGLLLLSAAAVPANPVPVTATGIPLDAPWKIKLYEMVHKEFLHPAWGWQHSERDYRLAVQLATDDGLKIDKDALFAAAFLHDMAAFKPCADKKMEHGECAALQSPAILKSLGFPMQKITIVQQAERGHMFYSDPGKDPTAIVLHDADSLDFLGDIGAARIIALTGAKAPSFAPAVKTLRGFLKSIPPRLITKSAQRIGKQRAAELKAFLDTLQAETYDGKAM